MLVVAQVALGVLLLAGSGLLVRTFHHLQRLDPGFDGEGVRAVSISLDDVRYSTAGDVRRLLDASIARMKAVPGVESAAATLGLPYERLLNLSFRYLGPVRTGDAQNGMTSAGHALGALAVPGVSLAAAGTAIGLVCALGAVRVIRHFVWGVGVTDPWTFAAISAVMLIASAVASVAPALRILRLDPAITLRDE